MARGTPACSAGRVLQVIPDVIPCRVTKERTVKKYTVIVERCPETGLYVGYVPGWPGAHTQGESLKELRANLREVIRMLLEDGEPELEGEFVGTEDVTVE